MGDGTVYEKLPYKIRWMDQGIDLAGMQGKAFGKEKKPPFSMNARPRCYHGRGEM
jgi:hypothetical protein